MNENGMPSTVRAFLPMDSVTGLPEMSIEAMLASSCAISSAEAPRYWLVLSRRSPFTSTTEVDTAGDGFFATFDGPTRAVHCAQAIGSRVRDLGLEIRAGVHTGEIEAVNGKVGGIAVHIGARIAALAGASEILVS